MQWVICPLILSNLFTIYKVCQEYNGIHCICLHGTAPTVCRNLTQSRAKHQLYCHPYTIFNIYFLHNWCAQCVMCSSYKMHCSYLPGLLNSMFKAATSITNKDKNSKQQCQATPHHQQVSFKLDSFLIFKNFTAIHCRWVQTPRTALCLKLHQEDCGFSETPITSTSNKEWAINAGLAKWYAEAKINNLQIKSVRLSVNIFFIN